MATAVKKVVETTGETQEKVLKVRMTLSGKKVEPLERVSALIIKAAKDRQLKVQGPVRMPTKVLRLTVRKSPCGEGSKTWDRFEMRVHKRVVDIWTTVDLLKQITSGKDMRFDPSVNIEVDAEVAAQ